METARQIKADEVLLDGEIVFFSNKRPVLIMYKTGEFFPIQIPSAIQTYPATFAAFDGFYTNGEEHLKEIAGTPESIGRRD